MTDTYLSILYPIYVPVTYFQGKNDGATVARNAELHFREVAQSAANLVMIENEGHSPVVFTMTDDRLKDAFRVVFADAVTGQKIEILPTSPLSPVWSVKTNRFPQ